MIVLCFVTFRCWRAVVVAVLPLVLTSILCEALMVALGIGVKVATLPVIALGVGIGVDYALYLLSRAAGAAARAACRCRRPTSSAVQFTGKVVVLIGVTLAAGVVTWAFSPIKFQADMGILLTFMFVWNMIGALVLIPALSHFLLPTSRARAQRPRRGHRIRRRPASAKSPSLNEVDVMNALAIHRTAAAHDAPLTIRHILERGVSQSPEQRSCTATSDATATRRSPERVARLASDLARSASSPGSTVGVMDWDSHRYLECFFAVPMMGAVLHTVNVRISPEQVLYTINHARTT